MEKTLNMLAVGQRAVVVALRDQGGQQEAALRLRELGMVEGATVELRHRAPLGGDPVAAFVRGSVIGMRRADAGLVIVKEA